MTEIRKEDLIFQRGEGGKLIPQEISLENIEGNLSVKVVPLTRGKLQEIYAKATSEDAKIRTEADSDVIKSGLISPELTDQEVDDMKPNMAMAICQAILSASLGISQKEVGEKTKEVIADQEFLLKKK